MGKKHREPGDVWRHPVRMPLRDFVLKSDRGLPRRMRLRLCKKRRRRPTIRELLRAEAALACLDGLLEAFEVDQAEAAAEITDPAGLLRGITGG